MTTPRAFPFSIGLLFALLLAGCSLFRRTPEPEPGKEPVAPTPIELELRTFDGGEVPEPADSPQGTAWEQHYVALLRETAPGGQDVATFHTAVAEAIKGDAARSFANLQRHKNWVLLTAALVRQQDSPESSLRRLRALYADLVRMELGRMRDRVAATGATALEIPGPDARYRDRKLPVKLRVEDLLGRMTLEEKVAQLGGVWCHQLTDQGRFFAGRATRLLKNGIGQITRISAQPGVDPRDAATLANEIQGFLVTETRLGIPAIVHEECLSGFCARGATIFPQAIGLASTWDPELVRSVTDTIRRQMRTVGATQALAPVLDVLRDPRWGRTEETLGEDPVLIAAIGSAYVSGLQGADLTTGVVATLKHFAAHGMPEGGRNLGSVRVGEREFRDVHLFPFERAVKDAHARSLMNAYHERDGVPVATDHDLLTRLLRDEWGFTGFVVSDYGSVMRLVDQHRVAADRLAAGILALQAGIDVELPTHDCFGANLVTAVQRGLLPVATVDTAVRRVLAAKFDLGLFENARVDLDHVPPLLDEPAARALARRAACQSLVLLENDGVLPLDPLLTRLAVVGPCAAEARSLLGDYSYPVHVGAPDSTPVVTILEGIRAAAPAGTTVGYASGCAVTGTDGTGLLAALTEAAQADVVVAVLGDRGPSRAEDLSGENHDRASLELPPGQRLLLSGLLELDRPVVVVLLDGRPSAFPDLAARCAAILEAWLPGEEGGTAVADVLFGAADPGGRLPLSFPRSAGQVPVHYNRMPASFSPYKSAAKNPVENVEPLPLYPFGHGLSYARFEYGDLRVAPSACNSDGRFEVSLAVQNVSDRGGVAVVQLYVRDLLASVTRPVQELKDFARVALAAGESRRVVFALGADQLAFTGRDLERAVEPGDFEIMVGASAADIRQRGVLRITAPQGPLPAETALTPE